MVKARMPVGSGLVTSVQNIIKGLFSYIAFYLASLEYETAKYFDGDDLVIVIRIKDVRPYLQFEEPSITPQSRNSTQ